MRTVSHDLHSDFEELAIMKKVAVVKEQFPGERRVALLPENVEKLIAAGYEVLVEEGAGAVSYTHLRAHET